MFFQKNERKVFMLSAMVQTMIEAESATRQCESMTVVVSIKGNLTLKSVQDQREFLTTLEEQYVSKMSNVQVMEGSNLYS